MAATSSRWVRERKRYDRERAERTEQRVMDLEQYLMMSLRETLDIRKSIDYTNLVIDKYFDYIRERMDNT